MVRQDLLPREKQTDRRIRKRHRDREKDRSRERVKLQRDISSELDAQIHWSFVEESRWWAWMCWRSRGSG